MAPMAQPTSRGPPLGAPIPAHDMSYSSNGSYKQYGANPGPGWSSREIKQIIYLLPSWLNFLIGLTPASFPFIFTIQIYHNIMTVELTYDKNRVEMYSITDTKNKCKTSRGLLLIEKMEVKQLV